MSNREIRSRERIKACHKRVEGGENMTSYVIGIEVPDGEINEILEELERAQETIYKCYSRLKCLDLLTIRQEETASGN